jgi:septal ring-binding cell division protein DamX
VSRVASSLASSVWSRWGRELVLSALSAFFAFSDLSAQTDPRLIAAVQDAQQGESDSARVQVRRLLASTQPTDSLYPEVLYTAAMVADDADEMQRQLQRVAVEYPASPWADDALLRLVQLDFAGGKLQNAARNLEQLRSDYPTSPLHAEAAYWAARTYFGLDDRTRACRWLADGIARVGQDVELQNRLGSLYQRCEFARADSAVRDSAKSRPASAAGARYDPGRSGSAVAAGSGGPRFRVQIAAVASQAAADALARRAKGLGYATVTVREQGLYKVRAGEFSNRADAQSAATRIRARLGGQPFVTAGS